VSEVVNGNPNPRYGPGTLPVEVLATAFDEAPAAMLVLDASDRIVAANRAARGRLGLAHLPEGPRAAADLVGSARTDLGSGRALVTLPDALDGGHGPAEHHEPIQHLQLALIHSRTILVLLDRDLRITWASEVKGVPPTAVIGQLPEAVFPTRAGEIRKVLTSVLVTGNPVALEMDLDFFGSPVIWAASAAAMRAPNGTVTGLTLALTNVTDLRDAERLAYRANEDLEAIVAQRTAELARWEQRFRESLDAMVEGFGIYDAVLDDQGRYVDARVTFANSVWRQQYSPDHDPTGLSIYTFPGARDRFELHRRVFETGEPFRGIVRTPAPGGQLTLDLQLVRAGDALVGASRDITDRTRIEDDLRASEQRLRALVEGMDAIVWEEDYASGALYVSPQSERILGHPLETWSAAEVRNSAFHPEDRDRAVAIMETRTDADEELRSIRADGDVRWLRVRVRVVRDADGHPARRIGVALDVTERRELENMLQHARRMESIGEIAATVAHDFDNVLYGVGIIAGFLARDHPDPSDPVRRDADQILAGVASGTALTRSLLAFASQQSLIPRPVRLQELIAGAKPMLARLVGPDITLEVDLPARVPRVLADPGQIEQLAMNLVLNARDALPAGGRIHLSIRRDSLDEEAAIARELSPGVYVRLEVADNGVGMTDEIRSRAFDPYFTTKPLGSGTGLGLATVYGIARQSHGSAELESGPGAGTIARIYLPTIGTVRHRASIESRERP